MKQVTVRVGDDLDARLRREAARRHVTIADLVREALEAHLDGRHRRRMLAVGVRRGGTWDIAHTVEDGGGAVGAGAGAGAGSGAVAEGGRLDDIPAPRETGEGLAGGGFAEGLAAERA